MAATAVTCLTFSAKAASPPAAGEIMAPEPSTAALVLEIASADAKRDPTTGDPIVEVHVTAASREQLARFSTAHLGDWVQVTVDGKPIFSPRILEPITEGVIQIFGRFEMPDAVDEARLVMSGKVVIAPVPQP